MKRSLLALPLTIALAGCGNAGDNSGSVSGTQIVEKINSNSASVVPTANATAKKVAAKAYVYKGKPDPAYKIVDEHSPQMPPDKAGNHTPEEVTKLTAQAAETIKKEKVPPPPAQMATPVKARLELNTTQGTIEVEVDGKSAPLHAKSFVYLAQRGFFDNTVFHRLEPGFVVQGGDPLSRHADLIDFAGQGGPGYRVKREISDLKHEKYALSMARSQDPDSAGSQFYITLEPTPQLDGGYTVFGKVVKGQEIVDKMAKGDALISVTVLSATDKSGKPIK